MKLFKHKLPTPQINSKLLRQPLLTASRATLLSATLVALSACSNQTISPIKNSYVFSNGDIVTMAADSYEEESKPEAIWVHNGIISAVGSKKEVMAKAQKVGPPQNIDLNNGTLMPGFVEPHSHLPLLIDFSAVTDLSPCLPERYAYQTYDDDTIKCPTSLQETWTALNNSKKRELTPKNPEDKHWIIGNGIDPSRLGNQQLTQLKGFIDNPAKAIEKNVEGGKDQPVFLLDQSGHVAYINMQAFVSAGICEQVAPCGINHLKEGVVIPQDESPALGTWVVDDNGNFTGKLLESPAYEQFVGAIQKNLGLPSNGPFFFMTKEQGLAEAPKLMDKIARTGVTTLVNAGGLTQGEVELIKLLATQDIERAKLRFRTLISAIIIGAKNESSLAIAEKLKTEKWNDENKGLYGAYGIKWWADGSTQGCSAGLKKDYSSEGLCEGVSGDEGLNYDVEQLVNTLEEFWGDWLIQVHANGDKAIQNTLNALTHLQKQCHFDKANASKLPIVLHHATVGGGVSNDINIIKQVGELREKRVECLRRLDGRTHKMVNKLDITVSHTPGHIAYWGGAFQSILDGKGQSPTESDADGRTTTLDPTQKDIEYRIPMSLHSDAPVTPVNPLWYVEQVVTRNTWFYPELSDEDAQPMPVNLAYGDQRIDVYKALRGITIVPAMQNLLDDKIGTLEEGKVADLVILNKNPLTIDENTIHSIKVKATYVNGVAHNW